MNRHTDAPYPTAYSDGIALFQAGHFWHAHEQWERCWIGTAEPDNTFYKGIIQAAAALYHWQKQNMRGLQRNWAKSRIKLASVAPVYNGLDVARFIAAMDVFVATPPPLGTEPFPLLVLVS